MVSQKQSGLFKGVAAPTRSPTKGVIEFDSGLTRITGMSDNTPPTGVLDASDINPQYYKGTDDKYYITKLNDRTRPVANKLIKEFTTKIKNNKGLKASRERATKVSMADQREGIVQPVDGVISMEMMGGSPSSIPIDQSVVLKVAKAQIHKTISEGGSQAEARSKVNEIINWYKKETVRQDAQVAKEVGSAGGDTTATLGSLGTPADDVGSPMVKFNLVEEIIPKQITENWTGYKKAISGGQGGMDQLGIITASEQGLTTGGWMPKGFMTIDGGGKEFAKKFGLKENNIIGYPARTKKNIADADVTAVFYDGKPGRGTQLTIDEAKRQGKPLLENPTADQLNILGKEINAETINFAGPRASDFTQGAKDRAIKTIQGMTVSESKDITDTITRPVVFGENYGIYGKSAGAFDDANKAMYNMGGTLEKGGAIIKDEQNVGSQMSNRFNTASEYKASLGYFSPVDDANFIQQYNVIRTAKPGAKSALASEQARQSLPVKPRTSLCYNLD